MTASLALQLPFVDTAYFVDGLYLVDRFVVADAHDARKSERVARFVARRLLDAVKRDLQDHLRLDDVHRSVSRLRDLFEKLRELIDLDVGQSRIRFADVDQLPVAKNGERVIG